ncbi:DUF397 domain-containing protein [Microtetraspora sp. NBRC 13810]|uniref:DUF397 domain-containing protein n=1 Tax=Microtetraspora sp. NBRC 13810 TaxID=3030990 RepID=UPI002556CC73|nr:DUF397 domain-containing protein [Microtetraspora sp. NBRC 13810]
MTSSYPAPASGLEWRTATRCGGGNCVQVAFTGRSVLVRDSKDPDGPVLTFSTPEWQAFLSATRQGDNDMKP